MGETLSAMTRSYLNRRESNWGWSMMSKNSEGEKNALLQKKGNSVLSNLCIRYFNRFRVEITRLKETKSSDTLQKMQ